eukprot:706738_1
MMLSDIFHFPAPTSSSEASSSGATNSKSERLVGNDSELSVQVNKILEEAYDQQIAVSMARIYNCVDDEFGSDGRNALLSICLGAVSFPADQETRKLVKDVLGEEYFAELCVLFEKCVAAKVKYTADAMALFPRPFAVWGYCILMNLKAFKAAYGRIAPNGNADPASPIPSGEFLFPGKEIAEMYHTTKAAADRATAAAERSAATDEAREIRAAATEEARAIRAEEELEAREVAASLANRKRYAEGEADGEPESKRRNLDAPGSYGQDTRFPTGYSHVNDVTLNFGYGSTSSKDCNTGIPMNLTQKGADLLDRHSGAMKEWAEALRILKLKRKIKSVQDNLKLRVVNPELARTRAIEQIETWQNQIPADETRSIEELQKLSGFEHTL